MARNLTLTSPTFDTTGQKFGSAALSGGSTDTANYSFPTTSWTMECWVKMASLPGSGPKVVFGLGGDIWAGFTSGGHVGFAAGTNPPEGTTNATVGAWQHWALVSNGTNTTLYLDGVSVSTNAHCVDGSFVLGGFGWHGFPTGQLNPGFTPACETDNAAAFNYARYTGNFTPPTAPYNGSETGLVGCWPLDGNGNDITAAPGVLTIAPNNAAIAYSPWNWYVTAAEAVSWNFVGYFSMMFTASNTCVLLFDLSQLGALHPPEILWRIDDQHSWTRTAVAASVTLTIPTMPGTTSNYYHYLEVRVGSNDNSAGTRFAANAPPRLRFTGIQLDTGATVLAPVQHTTKILIYGDSIAEGAESRCAAIPAGAFNGHTDGNMGWPSAMREMLGCEVGAVGWGSTGYLAGAGDVPAFSGQWNFLASALPAR